MNSSRFHEMEDARQRGQDIWFYNNKAIQELVERKSEHHEDGRAARHFLVSLHDALQLNEDGFIDDWKTTYESAAVTLRHNKVITGDNYEGMKRTMANLIVKLSDR